MTMHPVVSPAVRAVCEQRNAAVDLVMDHMYAFLDASPRWTITLAALEGHLRLVQRLSARHPRRFDRCCEEAMDAAAEFGHLEIVQWLHKHRSEGCTTDAMDMAAANGHLHVVKWLHANRKEGCTTTAMDFAAQHGHLEVVQWLHEHRSEGCTKSAMDNAAKDGHLHVIQWLHANRREGCSKSALSNACAEGHRDAVMWLLEHRLQNCSIVDAIERAVAYGKDELADWLADLREALPWDWECELSDADTDPCGDEEGEIDDDDEWYARHALLPWV